MEKEIMKLELEIKQALLESENTIDSYKKAINLSHDFMCRLRKQVQNGFENEKKEIHFFKSIKPIPLSYLIYYTMLYELESKKVFGNNNRYDSEVTILRSSIFQFLEKNYSFICYTDQNLEHFDTFYFTRKYFDKVHSPVASKFLLNPEFNTAYDVILAKIIAYKKMLRYLSNPISEDKKPILKWSKPKSALVELIYALHSSGAINNGDVELNQISTIFQNIFGIELGDIYKVSQEIRNRQKSQTKFIDELSFSLLSRFNLLEK